MKYFIHLLIASGMFIFHGILGACIFNIIHSNSIDFETWKFYVSGFLFFALFFWQTYKLYWTEYKNWIQVYFIVFAFIRNFFW